MQVVYGVVLAAVFIPALLAAFVVLAIWYDALRIERIEWDPY
ncbi:hypothetical protein [Falsiroseomonas selenitidurans]|nr:hypothetical protein [Falsiroseomonas selenitidurans]